MMSKYSLKCGGCLLLTLSFSCSNSIGMFLSAIAAIHNIFLPVLSTGFIILASPPLPSSDGKTNIEVTSQYQLKQLKMRLVNFAWKLLSTCYLGDKDAGIPTDNPSLGANYGGSTLMEDPGMKGGLLVQAVVSLSMELTESDPDGVLGSLSSVSQSSSMGGLLQSLDKHHGLCEKIHELCNSGNTVKLWPSDSYILVFLWFVQMGLV